MIHALLAVAALAVVSPMQQMQWDGVTRTYRVYRPANLPRDRAVPLVVMLHGGFGNGAQAERAYGWDDEANRKGFVVLYPDGVSRAWTTSGFSPHLFGIWNDARTVLARATCAHN